PEAAEGTVEDALLRDRADAGWERAGELDTLPARLGGAEGLGVMRVVRSSDVVAVSVPGTWRPPAGEPLAERFAVGSVVRYEGPLHLGDGSVRDVAEDVRVTSAGRYMTDDGEEYDIANFEAVANPMAWRPMGASPPDGAPRGGRRRGHTTQPATAAPSSTQRGASRRSTSASPASRRSPSTHPAVTRTPFHSAVPRTV